MNLTTPSDLPAEPQTAKKKPISLFICLIVAGLLTILLALLLYVSLPFITSVKCTVEMEHKGKMQVFYSNGIQSPEFKISNSRESSLIPAGKKKKTIIYLPATSAHSLRIDLGNSPGQIKLYSLRFSGPTMKRINLRPSQIAEKFVPGHDQVSMVLKNDHLLITAENDDPYIVTGESLFDRPLLPIIFIPLIAGVTVFLILYRTPRKRIKDLLLPQGAAPSMGQNIVAFDGLRGLAILMVVADHSHGRFIGMGMTGVWIFMALSGFFLAGPFAANPQSILSFNRFINFFARRGIRIIPPYYVYITVVYLVNTNFDIALRHYLFLEGAGHLWVITQLVIFYLLLPFFMLINYLLFRHRIFYGFLFSIVLAVLANNYLKIKFFSLYGLANQQIRLFVGVFLFGIAAAYLYQLLAPRIKNMKINDNIFNQGCSIIGFSIIFLFLFRSTGYLYGGSALFSHIYFAWYGLAAAVLITVIGLSQKTLLHKMLTWPPLCSLGVISFSFYLFHPLVIGVLQKGAKHYLGHGFPDLLLLLFTIIFSYLLSCVTYRLFEKR